MLKINSNLLKCGSVLPRHTNSLNSALQWHTAIWLWLKCFSTCAPKLDYPDKYNLFPYSLAFLLPQQTCAPDIATSTDFTAYQEKKKKVRYISQVLHISNGSPGLSVVLEIPSLLPSHRQIRSHPCPRLWRAQLKCAPSDHLALVRRREGLSSHLWYHCNLHSCIYFRSSLKPGV